MPYLDPEAKKANAKAYREKNRELLAQKQIARQRAKKQADPIGYSLAVREKAKAWREANEEKSQQDSRMYARRHYAFVKDTPEYKDANRANVKAWREANRDSFNAKARARRAARYSSDVEFKLSVSLRRRLYMAVKNNHRSGIAVRDLGCSIAELKAHLERLFSPGMTWDNWSRAGWHIDHIRPMASFNLSDAEQVKRACHYTNLQPLWAEENIRKDAVRKPKRDTWDEFHAQARGQVVA